MKSLEECRRILGLADGCGREELKAAFRARAKAVHPDLQGGSAEAQDQFTLLRSAYETLLALDLTGPPSQTPPPRRTFPNPRPPVRLDFAAQLNSLLWDIEDLFRAVKKSRCRVYRPEQAHRDLLALLVLLDSRILGPAGLPDYFQSARGRPEVAPARAAAELLTGSPREHLPYTSVENYFFALRLRANRMEAAARRVGAEVLQGWIDAYQEGVHAAVRIAEALENDRPLVSDYPSARALVLADRATSGI